MKQLLTVLLLIFTINAFSQKVTNLILVGDNGITEDIKKAHSFIILKELADKRFERSDYKLYGPLKKLKTYKDTALTILEGNYFEYQPSGMIAVKGAYENNLKTGEWYHYNDTGGVFLIDKYQAGVLISSAPPDTAKKAEVKEYPDEREAKFKGKKNAWVNYLIKKLETSKAADKSTKGGKVMVAFKIDTTGKTTDIYIKKLVEYYLDDEAIAVIQSSPLWEPAWQNGRAVNAYRMQPITFVKY